VIRVLIADDEPLARKRLRDLLGAEPDVTIVGEVCDGLQALNAIASGGTDVVFLDIQMPILDGFEVLDSVAAEERPHIVFVTAFREYAMRAFETNAVDYLVKTFEARQ
jgi:two-component system, LytTR family, response regulator